MYDSPMNIWNKKYNKERRRLEFPNWIAVGAVSHIILKTGLFAYGGLLTLSIFMIAAYFLSDFLIKKIQSQSLPEISKKLIRLILIFSYIGMAVIIPIIVNNNI